MKTLNPVVLGEPQAAMLSTTQTLAKFTRKQMTNSTRHFAEFYTHNASEKTIAFGYGYAQWELTELHQTSRQLHDNSRDRPWSRLYVQCR